MEMSESEDVTQIVLGKPGKKEEKKDEEDAFVMEKIVEALDGGPVDDSLDQRPTEGPGESEGDARTHRQADRRQQDSQDGIVQIASQESGHFSGDRGRDHLGDLEQYETGKAPPTHGMEEADQFPLIEKILDKPRPVDDSRHPTDQCDEQQQSQPKAPLPV
jgi:hypothetical protein